MKSSSIERAPQDPVERLATMVSIEGVERAILAFALHPDGGGFERAHLLLHDPHRDELVAWNGAVSNRSSESLDASMVRAALAPETASAEPSRPRTMRWKPDQLESLSGRAWQDGVAADGAGGEEVRSCEGALRLEGDHGRHGLLVGAWTTPEDSNLCEQRLERVRRMARRLLSSWNRHEEARRAAHHTDALAELARCTVSSRNVVELLHEAMRLLSADDAAGGVAVWTVEAPAGDSELRLSLTGGSPEIRERDARTLQPVAMRALQTTSSSWSDGPYEESRSENGEESIARVAVLPLVAYERANGVLAVWSRAGARPDRPGTWQPADRAFLSGVADLLAMAFDQADRCQRLRAAEQRADELKRRLRRIERLAERGASAAAAAEAARNPIVSITAFARRLQGAFDAAAPEREYLDVVLREAERVERMLENRSDRVAVPSPEVGIESPNRLVQEALQRHAEVLVRRRVRLVKKLAPDVPRLRVDAERVREAVSALLSRSLDSVAVAGRMRVETRRAHGCVVVEIAHDGPRAPGAALEDLDRVFGPDGHGAPGLEAARRIVSDHGGELRVRSEGEWSSIIGLSLPILGNEDRRLATDRRAGNRDRRHPPTAHTTQPTRG